MEETYNAGKIGEREKEKIGKRVYSEDEKRQM